MPPPAEVIEIDRFAGVAVVLLAAGRSERFGANKLGAPLAGRPLAHHAAAMLSGLGFAHRIAVSGPATPRLAPLGFHCVPLDPPGAPQSRSIALGVTEAARRGARAVLIALADMPLVPARHVTALVEAFEGTPLATLAGAVPMPPAIFGRAAFPALMALDGDRGARDLLRAADTLALDPALALDIDTPADLAVAERFLSER